MKTKQLFLFLMLLITGISWGQTIYLNDNFEDNNITGWTESTSSRFGSSNNSPLSGSYSLKHIYSSSSASNDQISYALTGLNVNYSETTWEFLVKHGIDPSANNSWSCFLMSNENSSQMKPSSTTIDGYAITVNYTGSDDNIKLTKITDGSVVDILDTGIDYQAAVTTSGTAKIKVTRSALGVWTVLVDATNNGSYDNTTTTVTDTTHTDASYFGFYYKYSSTGDLLFRADNILIQQTVIIPEPEIIITSNSNEILDGSTTTSISNNTDFGTLLINNLKNNTYTIKNTGDADLTITDINLTTGTSFTINSISETLPVVLAENEEVTFVISFISSTVGSYSDVVTVLSDDDNESIYTFDIEGDVNTYIPCNTLQGIIIAENNFDDVTTLTYSVNSGIFQTKTGNSASGENPASTPMYSSSDSSWAINNTTIDIDFSSVDISAYKNVKVTFNLAAFSLNTSGNGVDSDDYVSVYLSKNGGANYSEEIIIYGNNNKKYAFGTYSNDASITYDGDDIPVEYDLADGNVGRVTINIPDSDISNQFRIAFYNSTNSDNEAWLIDDLKIIGDYTTSKTFTTSNVWSGDGNPPTSSEKAIIEGALTISSGTIEGCECEVKTGGSVTVQSGATLNIQSDITNSGGTITFENGSSLIQHNENATNTGNITYNRTSATMAHNLDYSYWASPVATETLDIITPANKWYKYDTASSWVQITAPASETMASGRGYIARIPTAGTQTAAFEGVPTNGDVPVNGLTAGTDAYYLFGNPYPSAIDLELFHTDSNATTLKPTYYFWTHYTEYDGGLTYDADDYTSYSVPLAAGTSVNGGIAGSRYVAAGQAFFAEINTSGNVVFKNTHRVSGNNTNFYRIASTQNSTSDKIWFNLKNQNLFKQTLLAYTEAAQNNYDPIDATTFDGQVNIDFYTLTEDKKLTIQARYPFASTDVVPMGYRVANAGTYTIEIDHLDNVWNSQNIYLKDKQANIVHDIKAAPYTFTTTAGVFDTRFEIVYQTNALGTAEATFSNQVVVYSSSKGIEVKSANETIKEVVVYDVQGRVLTSKTNVYANETTLANTTENQVLLVKVTATNGAVTTKKIVK